MPSALAVLIVSPDDQDHVDLLHILQPVYQLHRASGRHDALPIVRQHRPKIVICEHSLADGNWSDLLSDLQGEPEVPRLIVFSRLADERLWAEVLNLGGYDVLIKPFDNAEVRSAVRLASPLHSSPPEIRRHIEEQLRDNLADAKKQYDSAKIIIRELMDTATELGSSNPDGAQATKSATRVQVQANQNYADAVKALSDFILRGEIPKTL